MLYKERDVELTLFKHWLFP